MSNTIVDSLYDLVVLQFSNLPLKQKQHDFQLLTKAYANGLRFNTNEDLIDICDDIYNIGFKSATNYSIFPSESSVKICVGPAKEDGQLKIVYDKYSKDYFETEFALEDVLTGVKNLKTLSNIFDNVV